MNICQPKLYSIIFLYLSIAMITNISGDEDPQESPCAIPGSSLRTGMWYSIDMMTYGPGYLVWSTERHSGNGTFSYLVYIFNIDSNMTAMYQKGGEWYEATQWEFLPSEIYPGWYKMRNRRFLDNYFVTWSKTEFVQFHTEKNISNFVILEGNREEEDYMIWPVQVEKYEDRIYHQLKMKSFQDGIITWSRGLQKNSHLIQNDHRSTSRQMGNYQKDEPWYNDTLFTFMQVESSDGSCDGLRNSSFEPATQPYSYIYLFSLIVYILKYCT